MIISMINALAERRAKNLTIGGGKYAANALRVHRWKNDLSVRKTKKKSR